MWAIHTLMIIGFYSQGTRPWGQEEGVRRICSCRAAAPGAGRCVCATPGEGCGCSGQRWEAAGGFAQTRSGRSFHKTPEERERTTDMPSYIIKKIPERVYCADNCQKMTSIPQICQNIWKKLIEILQPNFSSLHNIWLLAKFLLTLLFPVWSL